ncbi:toll/interleukin-1 receptor domain-containing protein [Brevundimonas sp. NPDC092305]|uniref:toll/interleukin-1 receptor domain-containing protein n=1 Tax=Brevundimonas sp. NPDC092305 TaxID=3363957 RepID=UPI00382473C5
MVKVFISHQKADSGLSENIARRLRERHDIACYLDVADGLFARGEDLADHIRSRMADCTQLLAVVLPATLASQWVPWEVGVATEKNYPLATYSGQNAVPPEFLRKWPYMRTDAELDEYARISKAADLSLRRKLILLSESVARRQVASDFYADLRRALRQ